jgi:hypothetical protein
MHYVKLSGSLPDSSIWIKESSDTRVVWITMLTLANWDGEVKMKALGLAKQANVSKQAVDTALEIFLAPDPDSASENDDGRRIKAIEGGWWIINHSKYREMASTARRRKYVRDKKAEYRAAEKAKKKAQDKPPADVGCDMSKLASATDEEIEQAKQHGEASARRIGLIQDEPTDEERNPFQ